ncbi:MAG TPA: polysaccharide deacetylase family protein [Gemmatimonadales bacterium]|nr:polysaccharide deacetylase family protein [Gemmatimonadales bacterium]
MLRTALLRLPRGSQPRSLSAGALLLALLSLVTPAGSAQQAGGATAARAPNRLGRVPILEYHLVGDKDSRWGRSRERFRRDLQLLYDRGYRPITVAQLVDGDIDVPAGTSPVVFTFDDASPGQLRFIERNGTPELDPQSAVGIWLDFSAKHPDWKPRATFCLLSAASAGHAFFGDRGIDGQRTEWRFAKLRLLKEKGFELCGHTLWHANLGTLSDAGVQEQIARGVMAIDSAVPGYQVRTFALPLGVWPKNRALARAGSWKDPKTGRVVSYRFDAVLEVSGPAARSPQDPAFNALSLPRIQVVGDDLEKTLDRLDRENQRYVADGARAAR